MELALKQPASDFISRLILGKFDARLKKLSTDLILEVIKAGSSPVRTQQDQWAMATTSCNSCCFMIECLLFKSVYVQPQDISFKVELSS